MKDKYIWISKNKGERNGISDLLAGWNNHGGYHIVAMILFCEKHKSWEKYRNDEWLDDLKKCLTKQAEEKE